MHNRFLKISIRLISFSLIAQGSMAQTKILNLTETVKQGKLQSKQLDIKSAQVAIAKAQWQQNREKLLPSASIGGSYLRVTKPTIDMMIKLNPNAGQNSGGAATMPNINELMYGMATVNYTLFDGFKTHAQQLSSKNQYLAQEQEKNQSEQEYVFTVLKAYSELYKANEALKVVHTFVDESHQRVIDFKNLEKNGLLARNDFLKAQLQESKAKLSLLDAEKDHHLAQLNLALILGYSDTTLIEIDSNAFKINSESKSISYWEQKAFQDRYDLKSNAFKIKAAAYNLKSSKANYYPHVTLSGGYVALNVPNVISVSNAWNGGVGLNYNLASLWKSKASINLAKAQIKQAEAQQDLLNDKIRLQVAQAYEAYIISIRKQEVLKDALIQAQENYRIIKNKYNNKLATTTELLDADVQQLQAQLECSYAKADIFIAHNNLKLTTGSIE